MAGSERSGRRRGSKSAAALSLETIAVAAIILVVLIIVLAIFTGGFNKVRFQIGKVNNCEPENECVEPDGTCNAGEKIYGLGCEEKYPGTKTYCCKKQPDV
ncbi:hypothetical protein HYU16_02930 [Candidatus Woesearchaeota archaeon]|nr:hypothetical protein [Candidatus Woesearchaeota archaeon]